MNPADGDTEQTWRARSTQPVVIVYVLGVFCAFIVAAHFVFHSQEAVKALLLASVASVASLLPTILTRWEYRLSDTGLAKRPVRKQTPQEFKGVFLWGELSHLVPTRSGFRYSKKISEARPIVRFLKLHLSSAYSGEFHVEPKDLETVRAAVSERGIPLSGHRNATHRLP